MAVPRHDAAGLDGELAEAELTLLYFCRLLLEIDGGKHGIGDALASVGDGLARIRFHLIRRTTAGKRG